MLGMIVLLHASGGNAEILRHEQPPGPHREPSYTLTGTAASTIQTTAATFTLNQALSASATETARKSSSTVTPDKKDLHDNAVTGTPRSSEVGA